jgi:hypothetical protein
MTTQVRHRVPRPHPHRGLRALPEIILVIVVLGAIAAGVIYISLNSSDVSTRTSDIGNSSADLTAIARELPRFQGQSELAITGNTSSTLDAVYFSNEEPEAIANFYQQQLLKVGWTQTIAPHPVINANPRAISPATSYEFQATKDNHTVTITAAESNANPDAGSTQTTAHIERTN